MIAKPKQKCFSIDFARRHLQYNSFLLVHRGPDLKTIEKQKDLHSGTTAKLTFWMNDVFSALAPSFC